VTGLETQWDFSIEYRCASNIPQQTYRVKGRELQMRLQFSYASSLSDVADPTTPVDF
jgi:hypothetical protein